MDKVLLKTEIPEPMNELKRYQNWHFPEDRRKEMKVLKNYNLERLYLQKIDF